MALRQIDMGSSLNLSATVEALMLGIVMGKAPRFLNANSDKPGQLCSDL